LYFSRIWLSWDLNFNFISLSLKFQIFISLSFHFSLFSQISLSFRFREISVSITICVSFYHHAKGMVNINGPQIFTTTSIFGLKERFLTATILNTISPFGRIDLMIIWIFWSTKRRKIIKRYCSQNSRISRRRVCD
jgi:hypothetical protein